jgi:hypothetical protein
MSDNTPKRSGRPGGEKRGNSKDRRARKLWMLSPEAGTLRSGVWVLFGGDGEKVPCTHCGCMLDYAAVEADRIVPGGSYRRDNVQPGCRSCNASRSNNTEWTYATHRAPHAQTIIDKILVAAVDNTMVTA